ncbi:MAG: hypothetical protein JJ979_02495 [Roseibium sp.]|nr:hypothetical protein [Roseibium sp.]
MNEPITKQDWIATAKAFVACVVVMTGFAMTCMFLASKHETFVQLAAQ